MKVPVRTELGMDVDDKGFAVSFYTDAGGAS